MAIDEGDQRYLLPNSKRLLATGNLPANPMPCRTTSAKAATSVVVNADKNKTVLEAQRKR